MSDPPKIDISLDRPSRSYLPDEDLMASFQVTGVAASEIQAIEASVLWYTEGTGEEDLATHDFRRLLPIDRTDPEMVKRRKFQTRLPKSPLSYLGFIVKIRWAVRVRVFTYDGKEYVEELPFRLGEIVPLQVAPAKEKARQRSDDAA